MATGVKALAGMGIEGAAFIEEEEDREQGDFGDQNWGNTAEKISATNPAAEKGDVGNFRPTFLQQAGLHPEAYLSRFRENSWQFCTTITFFQTLFIVLFGLFVDYDKEWYDPQWKRLLALNNDTITHEIEHHIKHADEHLTRSYAWFQDVHVMIVVGFGFLMTFLKRYSWSSLGFNFLFTAFTVQWSMLVQGFFNEYPEEPEGDGDISKLQYIVVNLHSMIEAEFSTGAILISFGAVLGVASPVQLLIMIFLEIVIYKLNAWILVSFFAVSDIGGSLIIHAFGAYFGLAVARCLFKKGHIDNPAEGGEYHSDIFSLIGTVFLWMFWPSFNSAPGGGTDRYFAVVNTYLALCSACMMTYATSIWATPHRRVTMEHVQNATLAGGVAMGTAASMPVQPFGALIVGACAGVLSTCGYSFIKPALANAINLHDTCGVHNLHGMPAVLAGIISIIRCAAGFHTDDFISGKQMAVFQLASLAVTLGLAIVGGTLTGMVMNIPLWEQLELEEYFEDGKYWEMEVWSVPVDEEDHRTYKD